MRAERGKRREREREGERTRECRRRVSCVGGSEAVGSTSRHSGQRSRRSFSLSRLDERSVLKHCWQNSCDTTTPPARISPQRKEARPLSHALTSD